VSDESTITAILTRFFFLSARSSANMMRLKNNGLTKHLELKCIFFNRSANYLVNQLLDSFHSGLIRVLIMVQHEVNQTLWCSVCNGTETNLLCFFLLFLRLLRDNYGFFFTRLVILPWRPVNQFWINMGHMWT
jgi:hypothetical protein